VKRRLPQQLVASWQDGRGNCRTATS